MLPSASIGKFRPLVWAVAAVVLLIVASALLRKQSDSRSNAGSESLPAGKSATDDSSTRDRPFKDSVSAGKSSPPLSKTRSPLAPGIASQPPNSLEDAVSGFLIDNFRNWTSIPADYEFENLRVTPAGLTLADASSSASPRSGHLRSPALSLQTPAIAAPAENPLPLPQGAALNAEMSISPDGTAWSPWSFLERHEMPDGNLAQPVSHRSLAPGSLGLPDSGKTDGDAHTSGGPWIRYRLTLSAQSGADPVVGDFRIWKRAQQ